MVTAVRTRRAVNKETVLEMRQSGMPMREIAEKIGRSKERVRQILVEGCGSTEHEFLSTLQLCKKAGLPRNRIMELYMDGIIVPAVKWDAGNRDYLLWPVEAVSKITLHYQNLSFSFSRFLAIFVIKMWIFGSLMGMKTDLLWLKISHGLHSESKNSKWCNCGSDRSQELRTSYPHRPYW